MTLNFQTEAAIRKLCEELPAAVRELAEASKRGRDPIIIMVPTNTSLQDMQAFTKALTEAFKNS